MLYEVITDEVTAPRDDRGDALRKTLVVKENIVREEHGHKRRAVGKLTGVQLEKSLEPRFRIVSERLKVCRRVAPRLVQLINDRRKNLGL